MFEHLTRVRFNVDKRSTTVGIATHLNIMGGGAVVIGGAITWARDCYD